MVLQLQKGVGKNHAWFVSVESREAQSPKMMIFLISVIFFSSTSAFFHTDTQSELSEKGFFPPLHCQHRLKASTLLNIMVIAKTGAKSFLRSSLCWRFLPLGKRIEFSHLKTSHTIVNMYINKGNCKIFEYYWNDCILIAFPLDINSINLFFLFKEF